MDTPNIDRIANEGVKLTQFYVQPVCSPTRAALLTGRYPWKNGTERRTKAKSATGMLLDERTIAEELREAGYATWMVGKWHLGQWHEEHLPLQRGFDHHYGFYSAQIDPFTHFRGNMLDWHRNGRPVVESGYSTFLLAEEAVQLIDRHDGRRPFFLYVAFGAVHEPHGAPEEYVEQYRDLRHPKQRAMLKAMDVAMGRVMDALDRKGALDDTLLVFLNDNGGTRKAGNNQPYRSGKESYLEGGIRVPAVLRWPDQIPAGSESDALLHVVDLFPTFAGLARVDSDASPPIAGLDAEADSDAGLPLDGLDAWQAIAKGAESPREEVVYSLDVIRVGDWKLTDKNTRYYTWVSKYLTLYNIREDPYETRQRAVGRSDKVAELLQRLAYHRQFARDPEPSEEIPDFPPIVYGSNEQATFGAEVEKALSELEKGNPGPTLLRTEASGDGVGLVYDRTLDAGSAPPADAFRVVVNPEYRSAQVTAVEMSGSEVLLTLSQSLRSGETVGLTYEVPDNGAIRDVDGIAAVGATWVTTLGASFEGAPLVHDGLSSFTLRLRFSEPVLTSASALVASALEAIGGRITQAQQVNGSSALWELTVVPSGLAAVTLTLPATADCAAAGAVCTQSGKPLSYRLEAVVPGPSLPNISIMASLRPLREGMAAVFEFALDKAASAALTASVSVTESGSALSGPLPTSVSFAAGHTSATLSLPTERDRVVEAKSLVTATVTAGAGYTVGAASSATVTVEDDDWAAFTVRAKPEAIAEGESAILTVAISNRVTFAEDQSLALAVSGTGSTQDYTGVPTALTLAAGTSRATTELTATDDREEEEAETVTVTAAHGGVPIGSATVTIRSVSHDAALAALSLSGVDIGTFSSDKTAYTASVGHATSSTTVAATAAHRSAAVSIQPGAEVSLAEGANEIAVTVTAEDGETTRTYTVTVTRSGLPEVSVAAVAERVSEGEPAEFWLSRTGPATEGLGVGVRWTRSDGSDPKFLTKQFLAGEKSSQATYGKYDDAVVREDLTVTLVVEDGEGYTVSEKARSAEVVMEENDEAEFALSVDPDEVEEGESATVRVEITNGVTFAESQAIALDFKGSTATKDADYTISSESLTLRGHFAGGASSVTATLTAVVDSDEEGDETVRIAAWRDRETIGSATVTIRSVSHDAALAALSLSGVDIGTFSSDKTAYTASVGHATSSTTVAATAAHRSAAVSIQPGAEVSLAEGANEIAVTVTAEDGETTRTYTVTVTRSGLPEVSVVAVAERVSEGEPAEFRLSRTGPATERLGVGVRWTRSNKSDPIVLHAQFLAGARNSQTSISGYDDTVVREDLTVTLTLEDGEGYRVSEEAPSAEVVMEENDEAEFALSVDPDEVEEGESATVRVEITNGVTFAESQAIALDFKGSTATKDADYTISSESLTLRGHFAGGASSVTATLTAVVDSDEEGDETVRIAAWRDRETIGSATVTIRSASHDATLAALSLSGVDFGTFSSDKTAYTASVGHATSSTTVAATAAHRSAAVSIQPGAEVSLAEGANEIAVTVTAEDGETTRTYTVTVTRSGLPEVSVVAVAERVSEGEPAEFRLSRTGPATEGLGVGVRWTRSDGSDPKFLTKQFLAGEKSSQATYGKYDDTVVREDLTVTLVVEDGEGYTVSEEAPSAEVVMEENDEAEFALSVDPDEVEEGESATVRVEITNGVTFAESQAIALDFEGSTATKDADYTISSESLTLRGHSAGGASSVTATLTAAADSDEEGDETVRIAARRDGETIGSTTVTITDAAPVPLTGRFEGMPERHDGETAFTFELHFSEEIKISYKTLRDTAFEVTGGAVRKARRLAPPSNLGWEITVEPSSDADLVVALPATTDCGGAGAVCTAGGKRLSGPLRATVRGPGSQASSLGFSLAPENGGPSGIWSDGETAWVADVEDGRLYAYRLSDGSREPGRDIGTDPGPMGLWSDGETMWTAGLEAGLRAHRLVDGARQPERDLMVEANASPTGLWSDGETAWVADWLGDTVHAYRLSDGTRSAGRDIRLSGGNLLPMGLWSDGETLWVADWGERLVAYRLSDGTREPERDIEADGGDADPSGLWSGGGTLLATSWGGAEVRAHELPAAIVDGAGAMGAEGPRGWTASVPPIADAALRSAVEAALGAPVGAEGLTGLEVLPARNSGIRSLAGLEAAVNLRELDLGFNPLEDTEALPKLPSLTSLNLDGAAPDLTTLGSLTRLERLSLRHNAIVDLDPLGLLAGLTELDVGDNSIEDLYPLTSLTGLTVLRADRNRIADIRPLASLPRLAVLDLGRNRLRGQQGLAGLGRLRTLRLDGNGLSWLTSLEGLEGLVELGVTGNAVTSLEALSDLTGLRRLDLRGNPVVDLRPLGGLRSLVWVHVGGSRIEDLAPLDGRAKLTLAGRNDREPPDAGQGRSRPTGER